MHFHGGATLENAFMRVMPPSTAPPAPGCVLSAPNDSDADRHHVVISERYPGITDSGKGIAFS